MDSELITIISHLPLSAAVARDVRDCWWFSWSSSSLEGCSVRSGNGTSLPSEASRGPQRAGWERILARCFLSRALLMGPRPLAISHNACADSFPVVRGSLAERVCLQ